MQNVVGSTHVATATKFRLGVEIQSPTGLFFITADKFSLMTYTSESTLLLPSMFLSIVSYEGARCEINFPIHLERLVKTIILLTNILRTKDTDMAVEP